MATKAKMLTSEELASLLVVGSSQVHDPAPVIAAEHSAKLIGLGYVADIAGRLRMTTPGRILIASGISNQATAKIKLGH